MAVFQLNRRDLLKLGIVGGGGLLIGVPLVPRRKPAASALDGFQPNAFLRVGSDGAVTIWFPKTEMGQGIMTALPMLVAEELGVAWDDVTVEQAPGHLERYGSQGTGGSRSIRSTFEPLRRAGAAARAVLLTAAAQRLGVPVAALRAEGGAVVHPPSGRRLSYGELADVAATLPVPQDPPLKDPSEFTILGKPIARVDTPAKVDGSAMFGMDARTEGMRFATVVHPPRFGASLDTLDASTAEVIPGVERVVPIGSGVAVVARNTWAAFQGAQALRPTWKGGYAGSSDDIRRDLAALLEQPGTVADRDGDAAAALAASATRVDAVYEVPYLAHATMEPMNCTADVRPDGCTVWVPTQSPQGVIQTAARITGLSPDRIQVHPTFLGGGFGRRSNMDFVVEAVEISAAVRAPIQLVWTRETDTRAGAYRPCAAYRLSGGLDRNGRPIAWQARITGPSISVSKGRRLRNGIDGGAVEGIGNLPYTIPNVRVEYRLADIPVPLHWWRSVGRSQTTFVTEGFIDELAHAAGKDPFVFRRDLLRQSPRLRRVLETAAEHAGWGTPLAAGRGLGIAAGTGFGSFVAQVAEVSVDGDGFPRVHRVVCAVDCGITVNPDTIAAQMESGIVYGLSAALYGAITLRDGEVQEGNFNDYPVVRLDEAPRIEVHIVPSREAPGGIGEPGTPPIAPAVANAFFAVTGTRVRRLPFRSALTDATAPAVGG